METKKQIRQKILAYRDGFETEDLLGKSYEIMEKTVGHYCFRQASAILTYVNFGSEVSTKGIIQYAFLVGKRVFVPKISGDTMAFYEISALWQLTPGYKGILEPAGAEKDRWNFNSENTLLLVPGVAFDRTGNRIGYGKGYYDRFMADGFLGTRMALGYECQLLLEVPTDENDQKVDIIVTENRVIEI